MRFALFLPAFLALSFTVFADDPPKEEGKDPQKEGEDHFFEFLAVWRKTAAHMDEGLTRTFSFEAKGGEVPVTGTVEIVTKVPEMEVIAFEKKVTVDHEDDLKGKRVELPPMISARIWAEPPPVQFPEKAHVTLEKDVEMKVGEKTLKCWKLTVKTGDDAPVSNLDMAFWFTEEGHVGLVRATMSSANGKSMTLQLISWKAGDK